MKEPQGASGTPIGMVANVDCAPFGAMRRISPVSAMSMYRLPSRSKTRLSGVSSREASNAATIWGPAAARGTAGSDARTTASASPSERFSGKTVRFMSFSSWARPYTSTPAAASRASTSRSRRARKRCSAALPASSRARR